MALPRLAAALFLGTLALSQAQAATVTVSPRPVGGTVTSSVGRINCGSGGSACTSSSIAAGTSVTLTATPDAFYSFVRWTVPGLGTSTDNPYTFTMGSVSLSGSVTFQGSAPAFTSADNTAFTVGSVGSFTFTATGGPAPAIAISAGSLPSGVSFAGGVLSGTPAAGTGGQYALTITASNGVAPEATQAFTLTVNQPPAFTSSASATVADGQAFEFQFTATGWPPPTFSTYSSLPGLVLSSAGRLSGTVHCHPTCGLWYVYVKASNGVAPDANQAFVLTTTELCDPYLNRTHTFLAGTESRSPFLVWGYPPCNCTVYDGSLPPGVSIEQPCMAFVGTPAKGSAGVYGAWISAANTVSTASGQLYTLTVEEAPEITSASTRTFVLGAANSFSLTASGLPVPTFSVASGNLPSGVNLASNGTLSGTPAQGTLGSHPVTITATNGHLPDATQAFTLRVAETYSVRGDASADRKSDLFWRELAPGQGLSWWTMNANTATAANFFPVGSEWQIADVGDLDGDGKADLVWRRSSDGATYLWALDGIGFKGFFDLGILNPAQWTLVGAADLDGDGKDDIVWRGSDGAVYAWLMNGGSIKAQGVVSNPGTQWAIADLADMNGDGKADIVFRNVNDGGVYIYFMNGLAISSGGFVGIVDPVAWALVAAADFDGDGKADLLWRHTSGDTWVWKMNGASFVAAGGIGNPGAGWNVKAIGDFDGDGRADLVWRHTSGTTYLWKMNGASVSSYLPVSNPGGTWQVVAP